MEIKKNVLGFGDGNVFSIWWFGLGLILLVLFVLLIILIFSERFIRELVLNKDVV